MLLHESIEYVLDPIPNKTILGMTVMLCNGRTIFVADSNVHDMPNASQLANITQESAEVVRKIFGIEPRAALVSYSNFVNHSQKDLFICGTQRKFWIREI